MRKNILLMTVLAAFLVTTACAIGRKVHNKAPKIKPREEVLLRNNLGDSIAEIVIHANRIKISCDSTNVVKLKSKERCVAKFLLINPENYESDTKFFGKFHAYATYILSCRKRKVEFQFDFRNHKWLLNDANGKLLYMADLKSIEIFRLAYYMFPNNINYSQIEKELKK